MKIKTQFELNTDWLPKDYRIIFMGVIKKILENYDPVFVTNLYGTKDNKKKVNKPFTFHVYFPLFNKFENNKTICGNKATFYFSTNDELLATAFYNGIKKEKAIKIGENKSFIEFSVKNVWIEPKVKFSENEAVFKTIAPVLVNKKGNNLRYLLPTDKDFHKSFKDIITLQAEALNLDIKDDDLDFEIYKMTKIPLTHYHQTMTAWLGEFKLKAPVELLQLVYDTGIGVRRSQGFGMLKKL